MKPLKAAPPARRRYSIFIGLEVLLTIVSLIVAWVLAGIFYPLAPGLWGFLGSLTPQPLSLSGYAVAYLLGAGLVWMGSNTLLFVSGLRRL